jgi:hypothetical protein
MRVLGLLSLSADELPLSDIFARLTGGRLVVRERGVFSSMDLFRPRATGGAGRDEAVGFLLRRDLYVRLTWQDIGRFRQRDRDCDWYDRVICTCLVTRVRHVSLLSLKLLLLLSPTVEQYVVWNYGTGLLPLPRTHSF